MPSRITTAGIQRVLQGLLAERVSIRDLPLIASNFRDTEDLSSYLKRHNIVAIADIDTRKLTRLLREKGAQNGCILTLGVGETVTAKHREDAIAAIARLASEANQMMENIGARRLQTILERVLDELSFEAPEVGRQGPGQQPLQVEITAEYVDKRVAGILADPDLSKYIL